MSENGTVVMNNRLADLHQNGQATKHHIAWQDRFAPAQQTLKVAIIGKAPDSMLAAPYGDPSWEIWTLNDTNHQQQVPRWDRHFEIHPIELTKAPEYRGYFADWLSQPHGDRPIYMQEKFAEVPNSVRLPIGEITQRFSRAYFTNSVSWMMAWAIMEGASEIGLWGVNMAQFGVGGRSEYAHQRPSCEYFLGLAEGLGIKVWLPEVCDLLKARNLYGFDWNHQEIKHRARTKELRGRLAHHEQQQQAHERHFFYLKGALDQADYERQWHMGHVPAELPGP